MPGDIHADSDDAPLIRAVQAGDLTSFETLLDRHLDGVRAFISMRLPVAHLLDELTHETFVFAFRQIAKFTAGTSFRAWLRAIAANLIRAELKRFQREQTNQLGYAQFRALEAELDEAAGSASRESEWLHECIAELPASMRELLAQRYREEFPTAVIAARWRRTETWVWQTLFRLRQQLRLCIEGKLRREPAS